MEKGLKAYVMYTHKDMNASQLSHDLCDLSALTNDTELCSAALRLQGLIGPTPRMRYPDFLPFPKIPRDVYSIQDALTVNELTETTMKRIRLLIHYNTWNDEMIDHCYWLYCVFFSAFSKFTKNLLRHL